MSKLNKPQELLDWTEKETFRCVLGEELLLRIEYDEDKVADKNKIQKSR